MVWVTGVPIDHGPNQGAPSLFFVFCTIVARPAQRLQVVPAEEESRVPSVANDVINYCSPGLLPDLQTVGAPGHLFELCAS